MNDAQRNHHPRNRMRATAGFALTALSASFLVLLAEAPAAQQPCDPDGARAFVKIADQTSGAGEYNLAKGELATILTRMDFFGALIEKAVMPIKGVTGSWSRIVGYSPILEGGSVVQQVSGKVSMRICKDGAFKADHPAGRPTISVNWLWNTLENSSIEGGGRQYYFLNYPIGEVRGYPLTERPYGAAWGGDVHLLRRSVLVTKPGRLPFRYVTRREYLAIARGVTEESKAKAAAMWRSSRPVRPAAEQEAEKKRELEKIEREQNANRRRNLLARYLAEYRTDEEKRAEAVSKSDADHDARLARIAEVERFYSPAQLDEPAILSQGGNPALINRTWTFSNDLKTDRNHLCTWECTHGQHLVVIDESYFDRKLPRGAPQLFEVIFEWDTRVQDQYRDPIAEAVRDAYFAGLDFDALAALLPGNEGRGKPGPALRGPSSGDAPPPTPVAPKPAPAASPSPGAASSPPPAPVRTPAPSPTAAVAAAMAEYQAVVAEGDQLFEKGNYFDAVRTYERAARVAYNNKLANDKAALETRLQKARAARDAKKP